MSGGDDQGDAPEGAQAEPTRRRLPVDREAPTLPRGAGQPARTTLPLQPQDRTADESAPTLPRAPAAEPAPALAPGAISISPDELPTPPTLSAPPQAARGPEAYAPTIASVPPPEAAETTQPVVNRPLPRPPLAPQVPEPPQQEIATLRSPAIQPAAPVTGRVLAGRYRLLDQIGAGGMGQVYRGEHVKLGTAVAIKTMHPHLAASFEDRRRFLREARAASLLRHPNVVQVLDCDEDKGLVFLVMEFVEGRTLGDLIREALPPIAEAAEITTMILSALEAAHARGIVHRDLKPDNVLLADIGGQRLAKVTDFGLAHVDDPNDAGPTLTQRDMVAGTPEYMSPEQCRSLQVGPSADLYAVGCILTALLQGRPPFTGGSPIEIFTRHLFSPPPPLDRPAGAEPVPALLERLRLDLLAKHPDRRPQTAATAITRLAEALSPEAEGARLPSRKDAAPPGSREARLPAWTATDPALAAARPEAQADTADKAVGLLRLGGGGAAVDEGCTTGLMAQGLRIERVADVAALAAAGYPVVIVDAGADVEAAIEALRAIAAAAPKARAVVCASELGADRMSALVAAGAADVARGPVTPDVLGKKLSRVLRRGR